MPRFPSPPLPSCTAVVTDVHFRMSLAVCRDLGQAGVRIITCERESVRQTPAAPPLGGLSKYTQRHVWLPDASYSSSLHQLCQQLAQDQNGQLPALLPVGAQTLALAASEQDSLRKVAALCVPTPRQLDMLNNKETVLHLAEALDIPRPESFTRQQDERLEDFFARVSLPCVVKPRCGELLGLPAADRYRVAHTPSQLAEAWEHFHTMDKAEPQVQAFLPGDGLGCSLLAEEGCVLASICHRRVREYPVSGGPSSCCQVVFRPDLEDYAARLIKQVSYTGPCMVEFKEDAAGQPRILEVNPRVWGSYPLTRASGSGFSLLWLMASLGLPLPEQEQKPQPRRMIFALSDMLAGLGYLRRGKPGKTLGALVDLLNPWVLDGVFEWGDIQPALAYFRAQLAKILR